MRSDRPHQRGASRAGRNLLRFWIGLILILGMGGSALHAIGPPPKPENVALTRPGPALAAREAPSAASPAAAAPAAPPPAPAARPQSPEPDGEPLLEPGPHGPLPRIGTDGRTSIRAHGNAFDRSDTRPRIGLAVAGIGLSETDTEDAIANLPTPVALILSPYAPHPARTAAAGRGAGFELLAGLPLEPANFPLNDPGPRALLTGAPDAVNADRLAWALSRFTGYVGVSPAIGGALRGDRYTAMTLLFGRLQDEISARGLLYLDPRPGSGDLSRAWGRGVDLLLDEPGGVRSMIEERLARLEALAREQGSAVGLATRASPTLTSALAGWAAGLEARGLVLAPLSALIRRPQEASR